MSIINCYDLNGMAIRFLTQWDHDVSIRITGVNADPIPEFRFSNKKSKKAICIKGVATGDSMMSTVPNELLREAFPVYVQLFYEYPSGDAKTEHTFVIPVKPASMPDSEVYEPSEVKSLAEIEARLDRLERNGVPGSGGIPSNPTFDTICLGGDNGVVIIPEGTVSAPALTLYGAHGDEPVSLNNVADATDDRSVPNLGQVKRLMQHLEAVRLKVVHELPDSGEAMVLYLVPAQSSTDIYTEYLWVDGAWEVVGSQTLDLTGYATEDWVEDYVSTRLEEDSGQNPSHGGLTTAQIDALDWILKVSAYKKGAPYAAAYAAFCRAFGLPDPDSGDTDETLTSISATYSGGAVPVGTAVSALTGIVVTAHYSDGSVAIVTGYTISGYIAEGANTITVTYQGQTTAFTVTGVADSGGEETGGSNESAWTAGVAYVWENVMGAYVDNNNGAFVAYDGYSRTPYLACAGAEILRAEVVEQSSSMSRSNSSYNAFYDAERRFISAFTSVDTDAPAVGAYTDIAVPANAAFFVVSHKDNVMGATGYGMPYIRFIPYSEVPV